MTRIRILLIALAAVGLALGFHFLVGAGRPAPATAAPSPGAPPAPAVIAVKDGLPPGHMLRPEDLSEIRWPDGRTPSGAVLAGSAEARALSGAVTRRAFAAGELVMAGSVIRPGERGFLAALVTPGNRAIAVSVDATTAAGGLIWPGDRVDVILTQEIREDGVPLAQQVVSETILSDARILSTDQKLESAGATPQGVEGKIEPRRVPTTVTLEVTPAQAERITVAATLGRLHLTLRGVASANTAEDGAAGTWAGSVSPALSTVRPRPSQSLSAAPVAPAPGPTPLGEARAGVRVFRGSQGA
jgi:pilus assembly protein CpaB